MSNLNKLLAVAIANLKSSIATLDAEIAASEMRATEYVILIDDAVAIKFPEPVNGRLSCSQMHKYIKCDILQARRFNHFATAKISSNHAFSLHYQPFGAVQVNSSICRYTDALMKIRNSQTVLLSIAESQINNQPL